MVHYKDLDDLKQKYLLEIFSIKHLLQLCVIGDSYAADPALIQTLGFTNAGENEIKQIVKRNPKLDPATVRLLAFLDFESNEGLFIDPVKTDIKALRREISVSIKAKRIMFPWVYGRETVDTLVSLFGITPALSSKQTSKLLKESQIGVFQIGSSVVGPYGCLESPEFRILKPTKEIRGFIEVRGNERTRRKFQLATSREAKINAASRNDHKSKEKLGLLSKSVSQNFVDLVRDYMKSELKPIHQSDQILRLLGDTLTFSEAKSVLVHALPDMFRRQGGSKTLEKQTGRIFGDAIKFVEELSRPEVQQLLHLATNQELYWAVERAIQDGAISFVDGSSRFSPKSKNDSRLELSITGIRNDNGDAEGLFAANIMDLLHQVFVFSGLKNVEDLSYILDSEERELDLLIKEMVSTWSPNKVVDFVAAERDLALFAARYLCIEQIPTLTVSDLRARIGFKLGLQDEQQLSLLARLAANVNDLKRIDVGDSTHVLNTFRQIFEDVETTSKDILVFTWWSLQKIRNREAKDFAYNHSEARNDAGYIKFFAGSEKDAEMPTLAKLASAFTSLASDLKNLEKIPFEPDFATAIAEAESRPVILRFKSMFHNLNVSSQSRVLDNLGRLGKLLLALSPIRNPASHGNRAADPSEDDVRVTIDLVNEFLGIARNTGLYPELWQFASTTLSSTGFVSTLYTCGERKLSLQAPTMAFFHGLPRNGKELYFLPGCELERVGPLRFTRKLIKPDADYWVNFPPELVIEEFNDAMSSETVGLTDVEVA